MSNISLRSAAVGLIYCKLSYLSSQLKPFDHFFLIRYKNKQSKIFTKKIIKENFDFAHFKCKQFGLRAPTNTNLKFPISDLETHFVPITVFKNLSKPQI